MWHLDPVASAARPARSRFTATAAALLLAAMTIVTAVTAAPVLGRTPAGERLATAPHQSLSRTVGHGRLVNARVAAKLAAGRTRASIHLPRLSANLGARRATKVGTSSRNLASGGGRSSSGLGTPRLVAQPPAVVTTAYAGTTADVACGCEPPDPWIAVGPSHVVQTTNGLIKMSNRAGAPLLSIPTWALFAVPSTRFDSDPRILWDAFHSRWVGVLTTFNGDFTDTGLELAVSETADPTGAWVVYPIDFGDLLPDYPGISTSGSRIVLTADVFDLVTDPTPTYVGPALLVMDWSNILAGTDLYINGFIAPEPTIGHFRPAIMLSSAANTPVVYENGSSPGYFEVTGTAHNFDLAFPPDGFDLPDLGLEDFTVPPAPVQPGAVAIADAADERPTDAVFRHGQLWFAATGDFNDGTDHWAKARFSRVKTTANGTGPTAADDFVTQASGTHYFMPGVGINANDSVLVVETTTDPTSVYPTTVFGAILNDGTKQTVQEIEGSTTAYTGSRWGDFVGVAADPTGAGAVWVQHELVTNDGSWRTSVARIVSDGVVPRSPGALTQAQLTPSTLGDTVPVRTSWGAATDADSGVRGYLVERSDDRGGYAGVETNRTSTTAPLRVGHTVRYRISAIDAVGNVSAPTYGPLYRPTLYQSSSSTTVTGSWHTSTSTSFSGGSARYAATAGATATFIAGSARSISIVATKASTRGSFRVYVDNVFKGTISTYSLTTKYRQLVYQFAWSSAGTHRIKLVIVGTTHRPRVDLDAFVVLR